MYYIPNIIRETSEGLNQIPIQDILFQRREVECIGEIMRLPTAKAVPCPIPSSSVFGSTLKHAPRKSEPTPDMSTGRKLSIL